MPSRAPEGGGPKAGRGIFAPAKHATVAVAGVDGALTRSLGADSDGDRLGYGYPMSEISSNRLDLAALAERSGVGAGFPDRVVELGIVAPDDQGRFSEGDVRRIKIASTLERTGVSLEGLGSAMGSGVLSLDFLDAPAYGRIASLTGVTFADLAGKTGIPVELLMVIREAIGAAQPQPNDQVREDELEIVPFVEFLAATGVPPQGIERLLRVYPESLGRIAEREADWWHTELMPVLGDMGPSEVLEAESMLQPDSVLLADRALITMYHAQQARAWTKSIIETVETALEGAGLFNRIDRLPAIGFLDLTGYTSLTEERGDAAAADLAQELTRVVQRTAFRHGGKPVKWLGDGVMLYFTEPGPGVLAALEMVDRVGESGLPPAHVGLAAGPVLFQDGDYFGRTVNVASRIAEYARPGEVLVAQSMLDVSQPPGVDYTEIGPVELKGVAEPTRLWTARRQT